jgi:hypothetical protein
LIWDIGESLSSDIGLMCNVVSGISPIPSAVPMDHIYLLNGKFLVFSKILVYSFKPRISDYTNWECQPCWVGRWCSRKISAQLRDRISLQTTNSWTPNLELTWLDLKCSMSKVFSIVSGNGNKDEFDPLLINT